VWCVSDATDLIDAILKLRPEVVVLGLRMLKCQRFEACGMIKERSAKRNVVLISGPVTQTTIESAALAFSGRSCDTTTGEKPISLVIVAFGSEHFPSR
jgi:DNA-binding NtrC family response regulator